LLQVFRLLSAAHKAIIINKLFMDKFVKLGGILVILMLVLGVATIASAQAALTASITAPTSGASFTVGQTVTLSGAAAGGTGTYPSFRWSFSDGTASKIGQNQTVSFATAGNKIITLTVTDSNGDHAVATVNVTISTGGTQKPVITNINVGNITQTSVTITWTTDIVASSRVIYDTTSHTDISGETAPNFGYAASTPTTDETTKVTSHSVTISGLNPGTHYYFRVISQS